MTKKQYTAPVLEVIKTDATVLLGTSNSGEQTETIQVGNASTSESDAKVDDEGWLVVD